MALVFKRGNITVTVQTRDHRPAHVDSPEGSAKIDISGEVPKLLLSGKKRRVKSTNSFNRTALKMVVDNLESCRETWRIYHGNI